VYIRALLRIHRALYGYIGIHKAFWQIRATLLWVNASCEYFYMQEMCVWSYYHLGSIVSFIGLFCKRDLTF